MIATAIWKRVRGSLCGASPIPEGTWPEPISMPTAIVNSTWMSDNGFGICGFTGLPYGWPFRCRGCCDVDVDQGDLPPNSPNPDHTQHREHSV
jgi:hypothetical protein